MARFSFRVSAVILAISSLGSYGFGLIRDRLLATTFGAGADLDVFNAAFIVPDVLMNLLAAALTIAFIPVFTKLRTHQGETAGWRATNIILSIIFTVVSVAIVITWLIYPWLAPLVAPGFQVEQQTLLISTSRLLLLSPLFFSMSIVFGSALQGVQRFVSYALSPILYNICIVIGILVFGERLGIRGVIIGVVVGSLFHALIRLIELLRTNWRFQWLPRWRDPVFKETLKLIGPRMLTLLMVQLNLWVYTALGSHLVAGSISAFNLARNFQSLPVSLFGIALATAAFPVLSTHHAKAATSSFTDHLRTTLSHITFFTLPASVGLMLLAKPVVTIFLGGGAFTQRAIIMTAATLAIFALSIPWESVQHILARAFYAKHNTALPARIAIVGSIINIVVCWIMQHYFGVVGLACGFVITAISQVLLLGYFLYGLIPHWFNTASWYNVVSQIAATLIMGAVVYLWINFTADPIIQLLGGSGLGVLLYLGIAYILRLPEITLLPQFAKLVRKKLLRM